MSGVSGVVSEANSLVGGSLNDRVGSGSGNVTSLSNGNYVVSSPDWDNGAAADAGAVTWGNGLSGIAGTISPANSLVGSQEKDWVGFYGVEILSNGNYLVRSPFWANGAARGAGAVTWGSGTSGVSGEVSSDNSLVGSQSGDLLGCIHYLVLVCGRSGISYLSNGNYVVASPYWDNGAVPDAGAVTWGNGTSGATGAISPANSLVGSSANDRVGCDFWWRNGCTRQGILALNNGNYVVNSLFWDNGSAVDAGAVTWRSGTGASGEVVSPSNSLVGSTAYDQVGFYGLIGLKNGNYVVISVYWDNGAAVDAGAATWGDGTSGVTGAISSDNSLVGNTTYDGVGSEGVVPLSNGNCVVISTSWDNGAATDAGAVTWGDGLVGVKGAISAGNSLVGSKAGDWVGFGGVTTLSNGNYVVRSFSWDNGPAADAGAVTWGSGSVGVTGVVTSLNSLVGGTAND